MDALKPSASPVATPERAPGLHRHEVVLLATAPVVLALGRLILVPFDDQEWNRMLGDMAANHSRNALGWSLTLIAAALLTVAGLALVRLVPDRPRLTVPALLGVALGWTGTAAVASGGLVMGDMADSPERDAMVAVLTNFNEGNGKHDRLPRPRRSDREHSPRGRPGAERHRLARNCRAAWSRCCRLTRRGARTGQSDRSDRSRTADRRAPADPPKPVPARHNEIRSLRNAIGTTSTEPFSHPTSLAPASVGWESCGSRFQCSPPTSPPTRPAP